MRIQSWAAANLSRDTYSLADPNISPGNPLTYHRRVREFMTLNSDVDTDDFYRFFPVPAMAHCSVRPP